MTDTSLNLLDIPEHDVVVEDYDDEMILLNLRRGVYYSLSRTGADAAIALCRSSSLAEAFDWMQQRYQSGADEIQDLFVRVSAALLKEQLVNAYNSERISSLPNHVPDQKMPLTGFQFDKYQDVEDVLAFDPVHEVEEEEGWPHIQQDGWPDKRSDT